MLTGGAEGSGGEGEGIYHAELDEDIGFCGLF